MSDQPERDREPLRDEPLRDETLRDETPRDGESVRDETARDETVPGETGEHAPLDPERPVDGEPLTAEPAAGSGLDADPQTAETPEFESAPVSESAPEIAPESAPPTPAELEQEGVTQTAPEPALESAPAATAASAPPALVEPESSADPALTDPDAAQRAAIADAEASAHPETLAFGEAPVARAEPAPAAIPPAAVAPAAPEHRDTAVIATPTDPVATAAFAGIVGASDPGPEPVRRGNRGFGVGIAVLSSLIFTGLYGVVAGLLVAYRTEPGRFERVYLAFLGSVDFVAPVVIYLILAVLVALIAGRARWWAHALLSLIAGILVYAIAAGIVLLFARVLTLGPDEARTVLVRTLGSPELIAAGIVARETLLWFGLITAARGRRVTARYASDRAEWERADREARSAESGYVGG